MVEFYLFAVALFVVDVVVMALRASNNTAGTTETCKDIIRLP